MAIIPKKVESQTKISFPRRLASKLLRSFSIDSLFFFSSWEICSCPSLLINMNCFTITFRWDHFYHWTALSITRAKATEHRKKIRIETKRDRSTNKCKRTHTYIREDRISPTYSLSPSSSSCVPICSQSRTTTFTCCADDWSRDLILTNNEDEDEGEKEKRFIATEILVTNVSMKSKIMWGIFSIDIRE